MRTDFGDRTRMRLLLLDSLPLTYGGGYERFLMSFGSIAARRGHDVLLLTPTPATSTRLPGLFGIRVREALSEADVVREVHPARMTVATLREAKRLAAGADVLYLKNEPHELATGCFLRGRRAKLVVGLHSATEGRPGVSGRLRARAYRSRPYRLLARQVEAFHTLRPHQTQFLVHHLSVSPSRIWLIPNGIDLQRFVPTPAHPPDRTFRILFAGRLDQQKGTDIFLESLESARLQKPAISVTVAGEGPLRKSVESVAARMPNVTFVGYEPDPSHLYASHDLLVAPSRWEVLPLVPCEALACGLPLVLSDIPANRFFREATATAFCQVEDTESLAAAVRERIDLKLHHPDAYQDLRNAARRFAEDRLDQRVTFASLIESLENIV
jgi:glycosyltransferase involved in cell wall biosynthesis